VIFSLWGTFCSLFSLFGFSAFCDIVSDFARFFSSSPECSRHKKPRNYSVMLLPVCQGREFYQSVLPIGFIALSPAFVESAVLPAYC